MLDFFTGGGQDSAPQPLALQPLAIQMNTTTTGTIQDTSLYATPYFFNPGNRLAQTRSSDVPNYNEALGVLSVLRRPVADYVTSTSASGTRGNIMRKYTQTFRLTQDLQYVINPAAGLTVQEFQVALLAEGDDSTKVGSGDFGTFESNTVHVDPSGNSVRKLFRTAYYDAACIKNTPLSYTSVYQSDNAALVTSPVTSMYIKLMLNLKPNPIGSTSSPTQQNVLLVARYPVTLNKLTTATLPALPTAACGVLAQASSSDIQAVCSSSTYQDAIRLRPAAPGAGAIAAQAGGRPLLVLYPNPAGSSVSCGFLLAQGGAVRVAISDALGREVRQVLAADLAAGSYEATTSVADLSAGIYYCTLQTPAGRSVQKLVVTH